MQEIDVFDRIIQDYGPPQQAQPVPTSVLDDFRHRIPPELANFWKRYGWGQYKNGFLRLCDPRPFDPLLRMIFKGDEEFDPENLTVVAYTAFGALKVWQKVGRTMLVPIDVSEVGPQTLAEATNPDTGKPYSVAFLCGLLIYDELTIPKTFYDKACAKLGTPAQDEIFGFVPARQLGGDVDLDHLRRLKALEHMSFLIQLGPFAVTETLPPQLGSPFGSTGIVRRLGCGAHKAGQG